MTGATTADLLDLTVGQRGADFRFDVLDRSLNYRRTIHPSVDEPPVVANNINQAIKRTIEGVRFDEGAGSVDALTERVRPVMVLDNGAEFPLGVFLVASDDSLLMDWGLTLDVTGVDQAALVDVPLARTVVYRAGTLISSAIGHQLTTMRVPEFSIDPRITGRLGSNRVWLVGEETTHLNVVNDLAALAGAYSLYFDHSGVGQVRLVPDVDVDDDALVYEPGEASRIYDGGIARSTSALTAPNRYIVVDTSDADNPIVGHYDVPAAAPHSIARTGRIVATVHDETGLTGPEAAARRARVLALADRVYEWVTFSTPPDPRHDTYDALDLFGVRYREQSWSMTLLDGGEMTHEGRRSYAL